MSPTESGAVRRLLNDPTGSDRALLDAVIAISSDLDLHSVLTRIIASATELTGASYGALAVIGDDGEVADVITTGVDPRDRELIGEPSPGPRILHVPLRIRGTLFGNLYLPEKQGGLPFSESDEALVRALATAAGFVIENARVFGMSERRRQLLEATSDLVDTLQPPVDLGRALQLITTSARSISGAEATAVVQVPEVEAASVVATDGPASYRIAELVETIAETSRREPQRGASELGLGELRAIVIPLRAHLAAPGVLVALFGRAHRADALQERELLMSFADQAALALDRAQALEDRAELAVISDRERIARDLHDLVIQRLFATGLQLQGIRSVADQPDVVERLDTAVDALDLTIRDIRSTIFELQPRQQSS